jgi:hypothetical protein
MLPTIDFKLKLADVPKYTGEWDKAIGYFWDVSQKASLGGNVPVMLGQCLGLRLVKDSPVELWYSTLPGHQQAYMCTHYILFLQAIKDLYLGNQWQRRVNRVYEGQQF